MTTTTSTSRRSSSNDPLSHVTVRRDGSAVHVRCSVRDDGDFHRVDVPADVLEARRRSFVDLPWTMLDEHHGVEVREVHRPGDHDGAPGDVLVTGVPDAVLGCWVGDCAPVVLVGRHARVAVAHAGWRGLASGVLEVALAALDEPLQRVVLGPTIGPCCYEFGVGELDRVAEGLRLPVDAISGRTDDGRLALDVPTAVARALARSTARSVERSGAPLVRLGACTGCTYPGFSHRVRNDPERHVVAVWQEAP